MNKPLGATLIGFAIASMAPTYAATYSSDEIRADQQLVQSTTQAAVDTAGARATAAQDAHNVAISRQTPGPTLAERRADVLAGAVYPQSGRDGRIGRGQRCDFPADTPNLVERRATFLLAPSIRSPAHRWRHWPKGIPTRRSRW